MQIEAPKVEQPIAAVAIEEKPAPAEAQETAVEKEWKEIRMQQEREKEAIMQTSDKFKSTEYPLELNKDGTLSFYWFDAHEEAMGADIWLFGKVWQP